jgi:NADH-quinone oxidoreductase subunit M
MRGIALAGSLMVLSITLVLLALFKADEPGFQFVEESKWIEAFGVSYAVGIDGISLSLLVLTGVLLPIVVLASHSVHHRLREYLACMLILESAMIGTLVALDVFLFYVFWEFMLAPMYFLIGIWGGKRRIYATLKFVLYTVAGSVLMFVAILYVVWANFKQSGGLTPSFLLWDLLRTRFSLIEQIWLFLAFGLAMAIKVPLFPFHTWLPDAHVEAPTGGSVILAGVLLKMGIYGLIRFGYPLFPDGGAIVGPYIAVLAVVGIVYGACVAWVQTDMKKLVAYSSVSHLGYCMLGLVAGTTLSVSGATVQMINHGISTGALFLLVGVLYDRTHSRAIADYGGIITKVPVFGFLFLVFTLSSIALPLTNGFIGEFMILAGSYPVFPRLTTVALLGVVLGAVYMLTLYMKSMFGELNPSREEDLPDVTFAEKLTLYPLLIFVFFIGLYPQPLIHLIQPSVDSYLAGNKKRSEILHEFESTRKDVSLGGGFSGVVDEDDADEAHASANGEPLGI